MVNPHAFLTHILAGVLCLLLPLSVVAQPPVAEPERPAPSKEAEDSLFQQLAEIKLYSDDSVTMSPDDDLLEGFRQRGQVGITQLRGALNHESRDVRLHAVLLLAELPSGNDALLEALNDESCQSREQILDLTGKLPSLRDPRFIPAAGDLIHSTDQTVRVAAIRAAGNAHYLKVASDLEKMLDSSDESVQFAAAYALANMQVPTGAMLIAEHAEESITIPYDLGPIISTLGNAGNPDTIPYLLRLFEKGMAITNADDEPAGMVFSTEEHLEMRTGEAPKGAGIMLTGRVAQALTQINQPGPKAALQKGLSHANIHVRNAAIRGLMSGDPTAGTALMDLFRESDERTQSMILYAISRTDDHSLIPELKKYLDGPLHDDTVFALAALHDGSVLDQAIEMSKSTDARTRQMGAFTLAVLASQSPKGLESAMEYVEGAPERDSNSLVSWLGHGGINKQVETKLLRWAQMQTSDTVIVNALSPLARCGSTETLEWMRTLTASESATVRYTAAACRFVMTGKKQSFFRDSGEKVIVVPTAKYQTMRRRRLSQTAP